MSEFDAQKPKSPTDEPVTPSSSSNDTSSSSRTTTSTEGSSSRSNNDQQRYASNFIVITDMDPAATIIYVSPSVQDVIGYDCEELVGVSCYVLLHAREIEAVRKLHIVNQRTNTLSRLLGIRCRHKDRSVGDDGWIDVEVLVSTCYDCMVNIVATKTSSKDRMMWRSVAQDAIRVDTTGDYQVTDEEIESSERKRSLMLDLFQQQFNWESTELESTVPRICMILNRFSKFCNIEYISAACTGILGVGASELIGHSVFDFVDEPAGRLEELMKEFANIKTSNTIGTMLFKWRSDDSVLVSLVVTGSSDGLVGILTRQQDFTSQQSLTEQR